MDTLSAPMSGTASYSVKEGAKAALKNLLEKCGPGLSKSFGETIDDIKKCGPGLLQNIGEIIDDDKKFKFTSSFQSGDVVLFPCPLKQQDAVGAIKALEALVASALAQKRFGQEQGAISVDMMKVACFMSSAYITTVGGYHKGQEGSKNYLPPTDLNEAQSNPYRRLSAGMYETEDKKYYHIHGSLEASETLQMIGLEPYRPDITTYDDGIKVIRDAVQKIDVKTLEKLNNEKKQAGAQVLSRDEFLETPHGGAMNNLPPFTVRECQSDKETKAVPFGETSSAPGSRRLLEGIRVLELCRIIAGPTIGRSLAALGAHVMKVTCQELPDVPFFQVDGNTGKHCIDLNLKNDGDREKFDKLLEDADVVIDGYRPGSAKARGYDPERLGNLARERGKGYVYVAEDCFGGTEVGGVQAEWAHRPGWQQIADCVTGVAWEQGKFMKKGEKEEPVVPPFPMSDYGTGALGSIAALVGLYNRATKGRSWVCRTSLVQYDLFLLSLGPHTVEMQEKLRKEHSQEFFDLRHYDSVDRVGQTALETINRFHSDPFEKEGLMQEALSPGFKDAMVKWPKEAVDIQGLSIGHVRVTRPNGFDKLDEANPWDGWERDEALLEGKDSPKPLN